MKCRKLYKTSNKENYNIMFFKSKGTRLPNNIKCSISEDNIGILCDYGTNLIYPGENGEDKRFTFTYNGITITLLLNLNIDYNIKENSTIESIRVITEDISSMKNKTFYISFYSEETSGEKNIIFQKEFGFTIKTGTSEGAHTFKENIEYKDFCLAIKEDTDSNYADKQEGVSYSLIQRLSILKGELWYRINYGLPLLDKVRSGAIFDSVIINIILSHPDVTNITKFQSSIVEHSHYKFNATISTIYNQDIELSNTY